MTDDKMREEFERAIRHVLDDVHIETGRKDEFERIVESLADSVHQAARAQGGAEAEAVKGHLWNDVSERCLKCGDKDWFAGPECESDTHPPAREQVPGGLHPSVVAFAHAMQYKLDANKFKDGKGWTRNPDGSRNGWAGVSPEFLFNKLKEECEELVYEVERGGGDLIWKEAGDVGNIAMMLADVTDALAATPQPPAQGSDTERLNWLDQRREDCVQEGPDGEPELYAHAWGIYEQADFIREAIDKNMQQPEPPEK